MIRRGFWLVTGAVLGVTGYRKVNKLARSLTAGPSAGSRPIGTAAIGRYALRALPVARRSVNQQNMSGGAGGFVKDVREGMAEYWDLHRRDFDRTLGGQSGRDESGASQRGVRQP